MELKELRKQLRKIGYRVKTQSLSFGRCATYTDNTGRELPSIFSPETLSDWKPLLDFLRATTAAGYIGLEDHGERIIGHQLNF